MQLSKRKAEEANVFQMNISIQKHPFYGSARKDMFGSKSYRALEMEATGVLSAEVQKRKIKRFVLRSPKQKRENFLVQNTRITRKNYCGSAKKVIVLKCPYIMCRGVFGVLNAQENTTLSQMKKLIIF